MNFNPELSQFNQDFHLQSFDLSLNSLIPKPCVIIVMGDDNNRKSSDSPLYGCHVADFNAMRDSQLKMSMQNLSWIIHEILQPTSRLEMARIGNELIAPSPSFVIVMEAMFIISSGQEVYSKVTQKLETKPGIKKNMRYLNPKL